MNRHHCLTCMGTGLTSIIVNEDEQHEIDFIPIYDFKPCPVCGEQTESKE